MDPHAPHVSCPQCGGPVPLATDDAFVRCPQCRASLFTDVERLVRHVVLAPRVTASEARGALERFLKSAEVDAPPRDPVLRLSYQPWYAVPSPNGVTLIAGSGDAALVTPPHRAGDTGEAAPFDSDAMRDADVASPTIAVDDAVARVDGGRPDGARLLHVPVWRIDFGDGTSKYRAHVDAVGGDVSALALPPSSSRRMDRVAIAWLAAATAVFALEAALIPGVLLTLAAFAVTGAAVVHAVRLGESRRR